MLLDKIVALMLCLTVQLAVGSDLPKEQKPHLKDWADAEWFDGVVKIPLLIENKSLWYANLIAVGDSYNQTSGVCMLDCNGATTIIWTQEDNWFSDIYGADCDETKTRNYYEDGAAYNGYDCKQEMCYGSW